MAQDDHSRIRVGEHQVGIMGLPAAIEEVAQIPRDKTEEEIEQALLELLGRKNYIPGSARAEYGKAFLREFRKFLGRTYDEAVSDELSIVVLGPSCSQCNRLEQLVMQVLEEMGTGAALEHVTDIREIGRYGLVRTPALVVNGKIVAMGSVPSTKKIKELLTGAQT
jgi:small redox-active disulfide protein 2